MIKVNLKKKKPPKQTNIEIITKEGSDDCSLSCKGKRKVEQPRKIQLEETKLAEFRDSNIC